MNGWYHLSIIWSLFFQSEVKQSFTFVVHCDILKTVQDGKKPKILVFKFDFWQKNGWRKLECWKRNRRYIFNNSTLRKPLSLLWYIGIVICLCKSKLIMIAARWIDMNLNLTLKKSFDKFDARETDFLFSPKILVSLRPVQARKQNRNDIEFVWWWNHEFNAAVPQKFDAKQIIIIIISL